MNLRTRLLVGIAFVAVVLVVVALVVTSTTRNQLIGQIDDRLASFSPRGHDLPEGEDGAPRGGPPPPDGAPERPSDAYQGYVDADGDLVTLFAPNVGEEDSAPPDIATDSLPKSGSDYFTVDATDGGGTYRVLAQDAGDVTTITALPLDDVQRTISRLILVEVIGSLAILAALGVVSWWVVHLGIRPIKQMTATATRIAGGDLTVRVPESAPGTEAGDLAVALNTMLGNLATAFDERAASEARLRRFVADASHELRTPVTTIRGYAELYRHGGLTDQAALDDAMRRTEQEAARIGRLVEDMLSLAKLDEQRPLTVRPVDLTALARDAASDARATAPGRPITVDAGPTPIVIDGDEDRLRQVIANVVGNALVHTESRRAGHGPCRARRNDRDALRRRPWPGHDGRGRRARHRAILSRRPVTLPPPRRHRARTVDRRCHGVGPWRGGGDRERAGTGNDRAFDDARRRGQPRVRSPNPDVRGARTGETSGPRRERT